MPKGHSLDLDEIHRSLWQRADRLHRFSLNQGVLAAELDITKFTMSRVVTKMIEQQRMRRLSGGRHNQGYFVIADPQTWSDLYDDTEW